MSDTGTRNAFVPTRAFDDDALEPALAMEDATRNARVRAVLVDLGPALALAALVAVAVPMLTAPGRRSVAGLALAALLVPSVLGYLLYSSMLMYRYGQTVGKRAVGIRVVRTDGSRVAFTRFFLRGLPVVALGVAPKVGCVVSLVNLLAIFGDRRRCLHDVIADTRVVTATSSPEATLAGARGLHLRTISF